MLSRILKYSLPIDCVPLGALVQEICIQTVILHVIIERSFNDSELLLFLMINDDTETLHKLEQ